MTANFGGRRVLQDLDDLVRRSWEDVAPNLQEWLNKLKRQVVDGLPAGFRNTAASALGIASTAGTEAAGWAAADHVHDGRHTLLDGSKHTDTSVGSPAKGSLVAGSGTVWSALAVGANNRLPKADSTQSLGILWDTIANILATLLTAKGDLLVHNGTTVDRHAVGTDTHVLTAASGETNGVKWAPALSVILSPAQITANQDNYAPGAGDFWRLSSDASRNITGISAGFGGQRLRIANVGSFDIVLKHQDGASSAGNRLLCKGYADITLTPDMQAELWYDNTTLRWRAVGL